MACAPVTDSTTVVLVTSTQFIPSKGKVRGTQCIDAFGTSWRVVDSYPFRFKVEHSEGGWIFGVGDGGVQTAMRALATPKPGTVTDSRGTPCPRADESSYPLYATCDNCGGIIRCVDGSADWAHTCDYRPQCSSASAVFGVSE